MHKKEKILMSPSKHLEDRKQEVVRRLRNALVRAYKFALYLLTDASFKKMVYKRQVEDGPFKGGSKTVYKIRHKNGKEYAVAVVKIPFLTQAAIERRKNIMKNSKKWLKEFLPEFTNKEIMIPTKNNRAFVMIQPWVEPHPEYGYFFEDVLSNKDRIVRAIDSDPQLAQQMYDFISALQKAYEKSGLIPDLLNFLTNTPANIIIDKNKKIKITDQHILHCINPEKIHKCAEYGFGLYNSPFLAGRDSLEVPRKLMQVLSQIKEAAYKVLLSQTNSG